MEKPSFNPDNDKGGGKTIVTFVEKEENARKREYGEKPFEVGDIMPFYLDSRAKRVQGHFKIISLEQDPNDPDLLKAVLEKQEEL